jgi:hypothetical protein
MVAQRRYGRAVVMVESGVLSARLGTLSRPIVRLPYDRRGRRLLDFAFEERPPIRTKPTDASTIATAPTLWESPR